MQSLPLPLAIPAAAAGLAYLNGRLSLSYDWNLVSSFVSSQVGGRVAEWKDTINLFYVLENHARSSRANHTFIIHNGQSWTYAQTYDIVLKYGAWLKAKGVQKDEVVAMDFMNSNVFVFVWFGLWSIGAKPAFINYNLTGKSLLHSIRTSSARLVLVDEDCKVNFSDEVMAEHGLHPRTEAGEDGQGRRPNFEIAELLDAVTKENTTVDSVPSQTLEIVFFDKELEAYIETVQGIRLPNEERSNQRQQDMSMLIYTSGTTGLPKAAVISWAKAHVAGGFMTSVLPLKKNDIVYTCMPLYHSAASLLALVATLRAGTTICIGRHFSHKTFWPEVRAAKATVIHYVGETCRYLLSAPESPLDKKHNVRLAYGNGLRPDVWKTFKSRFNIQSICEFYAATEAPSALLNHSSNDFSAGAIGRNGSIATLFLGPNLTVVKSDPDSPTSEPLRNPRTGLCEVAAWNEPGELMYKLDPSNIEKKFQGYWGNSAATNSKIMRDVKKKGDAYFRSGDLLRWDKEGRWYFVDRLGDTFRWKAENVSTAEVGEVLGGHDDIEEANVYGVVVPKHDGRAGCAAIVLKDKALTSSSGAPPEPKPETLQSLTKHLTASLPKYAVPVFLRFTRQMHTTGTNKHQKHLFQGDGVDVGRVEGRGDALFWFRGGVYVRFTKRDLERIEGGGVKL